MQAQESAPVPFRPEEVHLFVERWAGVQSTFIEEPRRAVQQADQLVAEILERLTSVIDAERTALRSAVDTTSGELSTEELRCSMRRYRAILDMLLRL